MHDEKEKEKINLDVVLDGNKLARRAPVPEFIDYAYSLVDLYI
jgi:hypothetical protein